MSGPKHVDGPWNRQRPPGPHHPGCPGDPPQLAGGHPHRHGPPGDVTVIAFEGWVPPSEAGARIAKAAQEIADSSAVTLGKETVVLPDTVYMRVHVHRPPHGSLVVKFELEWNDGLPAAASLPIEEL